MKSFDVSAAREALKQLAERRNDGLGAFNDNAIGIGRFVTGSSPWEKHDNGDELLFVTDGAVQIEVLSENGDSWIEQLEEGSLFSVPKGKWHQLRADSNVTIMYISPPEDGAERQREHPFDGDA